MRGILFFLSALFLWSTLCITLVCVQAADVSDEAVRLDEDPVWVIREEFLASSDSITAIDEWIDRILLVIEQNPSSPTWIKTSALHALVGSCNSAHKYDKSIELLLMALPMEDSLYRRLVSVGELGAVHGLLRQEALNRGDIEMANKHAESTLKYYSQFTEGLDSSDAEALSDRQKSNLQQRLIFFKRTQANLLRDVEGDIDAALEKQNQAVALLSSNPELTNHGLLQGMGLDMAFFLKNKSATLLEKGDLQEAISSMIEYGNSASTSKEVKSFISRKFAETAFPEREKDYRDFLDRWFHEVPHDKETVVVLRDIGKSYFDEELYAEAIKVLESIRTSWWQQALDLDPIALREQRGGYFTDVLRMLAMSYQATGQLDKAAQCIDELKKLVPKDVWIPTLEKHQEHAVDEYERAAFLRKLEAGEFKTRRPWGLIIGGNFILIAGLIYLLGRKTKA